MHKKDGGKIKDWQMHHLTMPDHMVDVFKKEFPGTIIPPIIFTGTLVDDPTGRWKPGYHMRSTYAVSFNRETGIFKSLNTIYTLDMDTENKDIVPDLGNQVLNLTY